MKEMLPGPNVVALTPPARPVREFTTPPDLIRAEAPASALPDAPRIAVAEARAVALPPPERPQPRAFTPPPETRPAVAKPALPAAPELTIALNRTPTPTTLLPPIQAARRTFIPPVEAPRALLEQSASFPTAPSIETKVTAGVVVLPGTTIARAVRPFATPVEAPRVHSERPANLPAAPQVETKIAANTPVLPGTTVPQAVRPFAVPAGKSSPKTTPTSSLADASAVPIANPATAAAFAIVGLFPTRAPEIPTPKAAQHAGFSAGPQALREGGDTSAEGSVLTVPGLLVRNGAPDRQPALVANLDPPTSRRNLAATAGSVQVVAPGAEAVARAERAMKAPDPRLSGRTVYTVAIQMPNVTSYSGSWIVWFAEREPVQGQTLPTMQAPKPLRKVDPKYIPAAADEKVEGKVRLAAIIRKDGRVERVELLQHLDDRLDQSSQDALAKWEFAPALRNGVPVDIDAVFEIPFHIAPKFPK